MKLEQFTNDMQKVARQDSRRRSPEKAGKQIVHTLLKLAQLRSCYQGPVVQSIVSLTSSLRVISLTVLADSIYSILIFFAEKNVSSFCNAKATHIFSAKNFSIFAYNSM